MTASAVRVNFELRSAFASCQLPPLRVHRRRPGGENYVNTRKRRLLHHAETTSTRSGHAPVLAPAPGEAAPAGSPVVLPSCARTLGRARPRASSARTG